MIAMARRSWTDTEPAAFRREQQAISALSSEAEWIEGLVWRFGSHTCGWRVVPPEWTPERARPAGLDALLSAKQLEVDVIYPEAFPAVAPELFPIYPDVPLGRRSEHDWHVNGNGSLCLAREALMWSPETDTAADLVRKASCWFVEYRLFEEGLISEMSANGIMTDTSLDSLIANFDG